MHRLSLSILFLFFFFLMAPASGQDKDLKADEDVWFSCTRHDGKKAAFHLAWKKIKDRDYSLKVWGEFHSSETTITFEGQCKDNSSLTFKTLSLLMTHEKRQSFQEVKIKMGPRRKKVFVVESRPGRASRQRKIKVKKAVLVFPLDILWMELKSQGQKRLEMDYINFGSYRSREVEFRRVKKEKIYFRGKKIPCWRWEKKGGSKSKYRGIVFWIDQKGRLIKTDYQRIYMMRSTKKEALASLEKMGEEKKETSKKRRPAKKSSKGKARNEEKMINRAQKLEKEAQSLRRKYVQTRDKKKGAKAIKKLKEAKGIYENIIDYHKKNKLPSVEGLKKEIKMIERQIHDLVKTMNF